MESFNYLETISGQTLAYEKITSNFQGKKYLIQASVGQGKKYLISKLENYFKNETEVRVINLKADSYLQKLDQDFAPFLFFLSSNENIRLENTLNWGLKLSELIPCVGDIISKTANQKKIFPAIFNDTEIEILIRMHKIINLKQAIFICHEIEQWDSASRILLIKLLSTEFDWIEPKSSYICTCNQRNSIFAMYFHEVLDLQYIEQKDLAQVVTIFNPKMNINPNTIKKMHELSGGNIGMVEKLIDLIEIDNGEDSTYRDVLLQNLKNSLSTDEYLDAETLIDKASLLGPKVYKKLLHIFSKYDDMTFLKTVASIADGKIIVESDDSIDFYDKSVWNSFFSHNREKCHYHYDLANCIKDLLPSKYEYIAKELLLAAQNKEATVYYILSFLEYYRKYRTKPILSSFQVELLDRFNLKDYYDQMCNVYTNYFSGQIEEWMAIEIPCYDEQLIFEVDYIKSLICSNFTVSPSLYTEYRDKLEKWVENDKFKANSPFQWIRGAILLLGVYFELHSPNASNLLKQVERIKDNYISHDKNFEILGYDFLSKCNFCYTIDTAYSYTKNAMKYFEKNIYNFACFFQYYISLVNFSANALVMGKYAEAVEYCQKAIQVLMQNDDVKYGSPNAAITNLYLSLLLKDVDMNKDEIQVMIGGLKQLLPHATDEISQILMNNNIAIMYCYMGDFETGYLMICELYELIRLNKDVDDYYAYWIYNNYCVLNYIIHPENFELSDLQKLDIWKPLHNDAKYFKARNIHLKEMVISSKKPDISSPGWNNFPNAKIGPAWSFWGKWLLFSDIQFWSD